MKLPHAGRHAAWHRALHHGLYLGAAVAVVGTAGCAGPATEADAPAPVPATDPALVAASRRAAEERDLLLRLQETLAQPREESAELLNWLEHLLPSWENEQRRGREQPLEHILTLKVVPNFDVVLDAFERGPRERQVVAAWALGFARVPENDLGIESHHRAAVAALARGLETRDDAVLRNVLLGLWLLQDPQAPLPPLLDLMVQHHDPDVRSNAALALGASLTASTMPMALNSVLVAMADAEPKVRLHAAAIAARFPGPATTERLLKMLASEDTPLVRASMARALGAAGAREAAPMLLPMLGSGREVEAVTARAALAEIFGVDRGPNAADWTDLLR
jgi:hypothetical protein